MEEMNPLRCFCCYWLLSITVTTVFLVHPDCGLSVRWEPTKDTEACRDFSPANMKDTWTDPEKHVLQGLVSVSKFSENGSEVKVVSLFHPINVQC